MLSIAVPYTTQTEGAVLALQEAASHISWNLMTNVEPPMSMDKPTTTYKSWIFRVRILISEWRIHRCHHLSNMLYDIWYHMLVSKPFCVLLNDIRHIVSLKPCSPLLWNGFQVLISCHLIVAKPAGHSIFDSEFERVNLKLTQTPCSQKVCLRNA